MTSDKRDPQPQNDQGPTPSQPHDTGPNMKAEALRCAQRGWHVFPVYSVRDGVCTCRKGTACEDNSGKHPRTVNGLNDATTARRTIAAWWSKWPDANIGVATGAVSGLFVLDVDPRNGGDDSLDLLISQHGPLPDTVEVLTGGGGRHIYFAYDGVEGIKNSSSKLDPGLDIKTDGGYVVAPPSMHISGGRYEWEASSHPSDETLAPPPKWLVDALTETTGSPPSSDSGSATGDRIDPAVILAGVPEGERDDSIYKYACSLRARDVPQSEAEVLVLTAAAACTPPIPIAEARAKLNAAWKFPPGVAGAEEEPPPKRLVVVRSVADWFKDPPEPVEPIVTDLLLPGDQVVVGGARGAAKTWLAMGTALQLARGEGRVLGRFPVVRPVKVLYCHGELPDDYSTFARWEKLTKGGDLPETLLETYSRVRIRIVKSKELFRDKESATTYTTEHTSAVIDKAFVEALRDTRPEVVILDPWAVFYTGQEIDNTQIEAAVSSLTDLTDDLGIAWFVAHHFSQGRQGADPEDWWRGASRLADWASVRITLQPAWSDKQAKDQGMTRMEARRFANVRLLLRRQETPPDFGARFDPATGLWVAWNSPTLTDQRRTGPTVDDVVQKLWASGGTWTSTNKAKDALGVSHSTAAQVLEEARRAGMIEANPGPRKATIWTVKEVK